MSSQWSSSTRGSKDDRDILLVVTIVTAVAGAFLLGRASSSTTSPPLAPRPSAIWTGILARLAPPRPSRAVPNDPASSPLPPPDNVLPVYPPRPERSSSDIDLWTRVGPWSKDGRDHDPLPPPAPSSSGLNRLQSVPETARRATSDSNATAALPAAGATPTPGRPTNADPVAGVESAAAAFSEENLPTTPTHPPGTRLEHDLLGSLYLPNERYFGIQTLRAVSNYQAWGGGRGREKGRRRDPKQDPDINPNADPDPRLRPHRRFQASHFRTIPTSSRPWWS